MKKLYLLLFTLLFSVAVKAQNCNFNYALLTPTSVQMLPPQGFSDSLYTFTWTFSNGVCMYGPSPVLTFPQQGVYTVLLQVIDNTTNVIVCSSTSVINMIFCDAAYQQDAFNHALFNFWANNVPTNNQISWNFNDGTPVVSGTNVWHTFSSQGVFTVEMSQTDSLGATIYCKKTMHVMNDSSTTCSFILTQDPSNPMTAAAEALVPSSNAFVQFDFGDGALGWITGTNFGHAYGASGTYNICMRYINGTDTCMTCQPVTVTQPAATCDFVFNPDTAQYSYFMFDVSNGFSNTFQLWDFGDGSPTSTGPSAYHVFPGPGNYTVCMQQIDFFTSQPVCTSCYTITVMPSGTCSFVANVLTGSPTVVNFTASAIGAVSYSWDFGDGSTGSGASATHSYINPGVYTVCLYTGAGGMLLCSYCQTISITGSNQYCNANFTSVSIGLQTYFIDQSVAIPLNVPPTNPPVYYSWSFGDGSTSTLQFPNHQYSAPGVYPVCLTVSTVGCTSSYCDSIVVDTTITFPIGCNAYFVFTQLSQYNMVGVNLSSGNNLTFMWDFGDGSPISTQPYPQHQYASTGDYNVCLTVADPNGCTDTYCDSLHVDANGNIHYKAVSTPFNLTILSPAQLATSINENTPVLSGLYPNPATDMVEVQWSNVETVSFEILNVDGKSVANGQLSKNNKRIDISQFPAGVYMLRLNTENGSFEGKSFVKIK